MQRPICWARSRLAFLLTILSLFVLVTVPYTHQHEDAETSAQCSACAVHHVNILAASGTSAVTLAIEISLPRFTDTYYQPAPTRELWADTLSRGPPAV